MSGQHNSGLLVADLGSLAAYTSLPVPTHSASELQVLAFLSTTSSGVKWDMSNV